ncbi:helix-turn-helix transcriptional regulator [Conexibacter stalactiti]|uniref:Helix-turn-helix transcriptional regulator n=1 Tax=Conexibacter stalactiti TaxID=1940611 RepID=A0ABU4HKJ7_9ACTN|nr:helix-turn-helix transcriptional regulator [Conexibacter stalactiti]MDW5593829.1 helix-turn-helix transcriptional regulator [Conexibacter stalactiti]MEC5034471.1 helix-turn-helix transcriptional regulator [Conexibacter stalactiti]
MGASGVPGGVVVRRDGGSRSGRGDGSPQVSHAADARLTDAAGALSVIVLEAVARQLHPDAATFFTVDSADEVRRSIVHREGSPRAAVATVASWKQALREIDPLAPRALSTVRSAVATFADVGGIEVAVLRRPRVEATYRRIGVVNDARLLVRAGDRVVAGVTLWRRLRSRRWTPQQLETLAALQPLVEHAYLEAVGDAPGEDLLMATLTSREREVARLIARGATNAEIARALRIGLETVKSHTRAILMKLGARTRRDVMRRLAPASEPAAAAADDEEAAGRLLGALLRWSRSRFDGSAGGYAVLSGRGNVIDGATALAEATGDRRSAERSRALHAALLTPAFVRRVIGEGANWDVVAAAATHPHPDRVDALAAAARWSSPLVLVVRLHGRAAGLVWVVRARRSDRGEGRAVADVRAMQPLVEAAAAPLLRRAVTRAPAPAGFVPAGLTPREWEVARLSTAGASNAEIAQALGISEATVKSHMTRVLVKCGVRSRAQLIALVQRHPTTAGGPSCARLG